MVRTMPSDVTQLLGAIDSGDPKAAEALLPLVYDELRKLAGAKMAREQPGQTLQATALVHEAWMRIAKDGDSHWKSRGHFFGAAAEAMRRILVETARRKSRLKHGAGVVLEAVDELNIAAAVPEDRLVQVNEALEQLEQEDPEAARIVKLRYFAGLTNEQVAGMLDTSLRSVERRWTWAKAWLFDWIRNQETP